LVKARSASRDAPRRGPRSTRSDSARSSAAASRGAARRERAFLEGELVAPGAEKLAGRDVERDRGVDAGLEAGIGDRADELGQALFVRLEGRPVAAFVRDALQRAALREALAGAA
jgi:hypothetical protein